MVPFTFHLLALTQSWDCHLWGSFDVFCQSVMWDFRIQSWIPRCTSDFTCDINRSPNFFVSHINLWGKKSLFISLYILMSKIYYKYNRTKGHWHEISGNIPGSWVIKCSGKGKEMGNWCHRTVPQFTLLRRVDRRDTMVTQRSVKEIRLQTKRNGWIHFWFGSTCSICFCKIWRPFS